MGVASYPGVDRGGASFELDRLELDDDRLVVRGWWSGVRGVRFVRPGLVVGGRRVLATLEHKPWAVDEDGAWTAAFPWKRKSLDVEGVMLVVAPSVEVPLDRSLVQAAEPSPARPEIVVEEVRLPLRDELDGIERRLDAMHSELRDARAVAAEREDRCRELEAAVARERRVAGEAQGNGDELVRAHAMAVLDRDRALAQHAEAVSDREAAVRSLKRMERQRGDALARCEAAEARRDEVLAERDDARKQRDDLLLAYEALQAQLRGEWAEEARTASLPAVEPRTARLPGAGAQVRAGAADPVGAGAGAGAPARPAARQAPQPAVGEAPLGVRTIPAARTVAASLHRSKREREHGVTRFDMWAIRILGSVAALAFISLLVMILKAFFVF